MAGPPALSTQREDEVDRCAPPRRIRVLAAVCEPLLQAGVQASLSHEPDIELVGDGGALPPAADVLVADGATAIERLDAGRRAAPAGGLRAVAVLAVVAQAREHAVRAVLARGVRGVVLVGSPLPELVAGVRTLARGGRYLCPPVAYQLAHGPAHERLTAREEEVLRLLARGGGNQSIARDLDIAVGTVKVHVKAILSKLDARSRTEAASIAAGRGLVEWPAPSLEGVFGRTGEWSWRAVA